MPPAVSSRKSAAILLTLFVQVHATAAGTDTETTVTAGDRVVIQARLLFAPSTDIRRQALQWMRERNKADVVPALIHALRYVGDKDGEITTLLHTLTGADHGADWFKWMLWQQAHPEIKPFAEFDQFQSDVFASIDPNFRVFIYAGVRHEIRLEEITWGGIAKDGIPALNSPSFVKAEAARYLTDEEPVFGIEINGDARAYPYRIMDWHEMANDV
ncbi:MAG: DUF3179 domain-containing (seleno)protein, partial [Chromatiales bacterium]